MQRWKNIVFNITIGAASLLVFFLIFESRLTLPPWLQVFGRMHPLLLHFPITLFVLLFAARLFVPQRLLNTENGAAIMEGLLLFTAFTAVFTSLMGLFLSRETGYDAAAISWHKWSASLVSLFAVIVYGFREKLWNGRVAGLSTSLAAFAVILFTGHEGAGITHGDGFLLAPVIKEKKAERKPFEEALVYADLIKPILDEKCMSCHNQRKAKGGLIMETEELLVKGGKGGAPWDLSKPDLGLLLNRVHLPEDAKKHMPPAGKQQLTDQEVSILTLWIRSGSSFKQKLAALPETDSLRMIAEHIFSSGAEEQYDFAAADEKKVKALNVDGRSVAQLSLESPALTAGYFNSEAYSSASLKELLAVKQQLVVLELDHMPVKDEDLSTIAQFSNLRKLNLSFTGITGKNLGQLQSIKTLREISLSGNKISKADLLALQSWPGLQRVYAWNTAMSPAEADALRVVKGKIAFETGFRSDTVQMKLTPPILVNEEQVILSPVTLKLKHYINGAVIRYTTDGTIPDSVRSPVYAPGIVLNTNTVLKAKAFKPGWFSSDVMEAYFYATKFKPDSVILLQLPEEPYVAEGPRSLADLEKGDLNFRSGKWMGFRKNKMECLLQFNAPVTAQSITLSTLQDIGSYIMPPSSIEVWGGMDKNKLTLLGRTIPAQPTEPTTPSQRGFQVDFKTTNVKYIRLVVTPVAKLPAWHPGKGDKGWVFTDEIFVN